ncbi:MAG: phenylalanine--tRNA ligase subunit beta [Candidatus Omnitrophica bacterium]|nr:phenylalanine--tRNA ligase subunit beta [Candidatus Omnitrophota bacterium]
MRYSHKLIAQYIGGAVGKDELIGYLEMLGLNPSAIRKADGDAVFELETPANRGDLLSLTGVAREVLPFTTHSLKMPASGFKEKNSSLLPVKIEDKNDCYYYSCRIIKGIDPSAHPAWLKESMEKLGYRSSFSVVDISNYAMAETGQPLHIFDLDKIEGFVEVRRARKGEILTTLDGKKRELDAGVLVIADSKKAVALAGIMGGENSEVAAHTKNILIESAVFNPVVVRRGRRKLGLATEASARFERGIDAGCCKQGMARAAFLVSEICGGEAGPLSEEGIMDEQPPEIRLDGKKVDRLSGLEIEGAFIKNLLNKLNFDVKKRGSVYAVKPPPYRKDIREDVDVIEEVVKYRQYSEVPSEMPVASIKPTPSSAEVEAAEKIKDIAVRLGFTEVVNMGITSKENAALPGGPVPAEIENPLSANLGFLRTSLIPEMLEAAGFNVNREVKNLDIFELGRVYRKENSSYGEEWMLSFLSVNSGGFFSLKGKIHKLLEKSGIKDIDYASQPGIFSKEENLGVCCGGVETGNIFIVSEGIKGRYGLQKEDICGGEIRLEGVREKISFAGVFREQARYPSSRRDFSFVFPESLIWKKVEDLILSLELPVEKIECFDFYRGKNIPGSSISVSFSVIFRSSERTLGSEEVAGFTEKIINAVCSVLEGKLRGGSGDS